MASLLDFLKIPIWQAPTSSIAGPELAAAVSKAGGMGAMALTWTEPEIAKSYVLQVIGETQNPFLVNYALTFPPLSLEAALEAGAPIISFSWGDPEPFLPLVRSFGALIGIQVTNPAGARRAVELGADFLICQGIEAGGHVQSTTALRDLLPQILDDAGSIPVIPAGGLATGRDIAEVLKLGASGAMLGTRFVATQESRAHPEYKKLLTEASGATALTACFDGGWPQSSHRVLRNSTLETWESHGSPSSGSRPGEGDAVARSLSGEPILRYDSTAPRHEHSGEIEAMCLYAGAGCGEIHDIPPASDLLHRLWSEASAS